LEAEALPVLDAACSAIASAFAGGELKAGLRDEDVHTLVERELTERLGEIGSRIHAGRSRNDLVVTDLRLWARDAAEELAASARRFIGALCELAEEHADTVMPGYTHLQRAQPISLGFHLLAHAFTALRDVGRFEAARSAADVSALGAGALAGTTLQIDPSVAAAEMGFGATFSNAMDAVSDRDFAADLIYACALTGVHLSRLAEEVVAWTSAEFGFARLADAWSTGSSMMPQKRNPDLAELLRGRSAGGIADLTGLLSLLKGLPLAYDRDLQEDKGFLFGAVDRASDGLAAATHLVRALDFDLERLAAAAGGGGSYATDLAEALVERGVPFRDAHEATGALIAGLESEGLVLEEVPSGYLSRFHEAFRDEDRALNDPRRSLAARRNKGGPAPERVLEQVAELRQAIS
jgi:argininosuccinate lyase